jgi:hypothetical protein
LGDLVRSRGLFNLQTSEAAIKATEARRSQIENRSTAIQSYFDDRQRSRELRSAERGPRPTVSDFARYARAGRPQRPSPGELDTFSGRLFWPIVLQGEAFVQPRSALEELFKLRALNRRMELSEYLQARQAVEAMAATLRDQIRQVPPDDYVAARRFLTSLAYEAQSPVGPHPGLAGIR